ncbi:iron ABC transporter permease [Nocardioides sp. BP30]|uniref:ABC transporter permease n=1 Tax=Nocardioides sp. BP30 TaxID=3036374 RepID=UPI0024687C99|nr:iron ABC transporter permease [Nocardioides sp. BP30]WGL52468.1 iron ABC transporter permease [Nocardioides sp. BP30]
MATMIDNPPSTAVTPEPAPRRFDWRRYVNGRYVTLVVASVAVAYLALVPVCTMVYASLQTNFLGIGQSKWTLDNFHQTFAAPGFGSLVANSFAYAIATALVCIVIGFGLAWFVVRTNAPFKSFARAAALVPMIIPGILNTIAWSLLLSPQQGPLNQLLRHVGLPAFDVYSLHGMIFVQSMHVVPIAFLMGTAAFSAMDSSLEEAAMASGASARRTFFTITLRMARPAIMSAALLMFIQTISTFEVPQLIGVPGHSYVFVSKIYSALQQFPADYGTVGTIGVFVLVIAVLGLWLSRRFAKGNGVQTITGKGFRAQVQDIGAWRWVGLGCFLLFFLVAAVLPMAMLLWSSFLPGYEPPSVQALKDFTLKNYSDIFHNTVLLRSLKNSIIVSFTTGIVVTALSAVVAYITVKTKVAGRGILDGLATIPIAVPSIVMGVGILYFYLAAPLPVHLYGTLTILVIAFVTITMPYGMRYIVPGMAAIKDELEEAATSSGASWLQSFGRVFVPLLMPSLLAAFLYSMIVSFREISAAIFLYSSGTEVVSVQIYDLYRNGTYPVVAALGILMVLFLVVLVALVQLLSRAFGIKQRR